MKKTIIFTFLAFWMFLFATPVFAFPTLIPEECTGAALLDDPSTAQAECVECELGKESGPQCCCNLSSVERMAVNVTQIILGVAGSIALLAFVVGGVLYMTSGGEPGKVQKATTMLQTAVIGLAIILLSGLIVQTILRKLTGT